MVVHRRRARLDEEDVGTADRFAESAVRLAVSEGLVLHGPRRVPRRSAIRSANSGFDVPEKTSGSRRDSSDRANQRISEVEDPVPVERGEGTLSAPGTGGEIVSQRHSYEPCLEVAEVEVCSRGKR